MKGGYFARLALILYNRWTALTVASGSIVRSDGFCKLRVCTRILHNDFEQGAGTPAE